MVLDGTAAGPAFDFGSGTNATLEFILTGDPTTGNAVYLAMGTANSLRYSAWKATHQLGFTDITGWGTDWKFTPAVASPTIATHITYVWNAATVTMKIYVNGLLKGTCVATGTGFVMPFGQGVLGDDGTTSELLKGTIYRVTGYTSMLSDATIQSHGQAFANVMASPAILSFTASPTEIPLGQSSTLGWAVQNALQVTVNGTVVTGTSLTVTPQMSTIYVLTVSNALGTTSSQLRLQVDPNLSAYDAVITADAASGLAPLAKLTSQFYTLGTIGVPFNFGTSSGDGTMEFIVEGDPNPGAGTSLAVDYDPVTGNWRNSLRYSQWSSSTAAISLVGTLGFSLGTAGDYGFNPLVPSPAVPQHITYVWHSTLSEMYLYVNGYLVSGTMSGNPGCGMPTGAGTLGRDGFAGTMYRVTAYAGQLPAATILRHGKAFAPLAHGPAALPPYTAAQMGLRMTTAETGGDWTRELLATAGLNYSWIGSSTPVTYSTTIASYPGTQYPGFQSVIYMIPNGPLGDPGIDYDATDCVEFSIKNNANGTATGLLEYKTNEPSGNAQFTTNIVASITTSTVLGTWSVTFNNDTNVTVTGPGGVSKIGNFPDEATAQVFANPLRLYYGDQQGGAANASAPPAIFSEFAVSGLSGASFDDTFTEATINTNLWVLDAPTPGNITLVSAAAGAQGWLSLAVNPWEKGLQVSTNLAQAGDFNLSALV